MIDLFLGWVYPIGMSQAIASKMKEIRRRLELTQTQIAKLAGTSNSYVAHLEKGEMMPSLEFAFKIEKALKIQGELSNLVIGAAKEAVGVLHTTHEQTKKSNFPWPLKSPGLESIHLAQLCPSCGGNINLRLNFGLS